MDLVDVIKTRYSCRNFLPKTISDEMIEKILTLSQRAPSAGNLQAAKIISIRDHPTLKKELAVAASGQDFIRTAPVIFVILACPSISGIRYRERGKRLYSVQDATILASYIQLICTNFGLASVWVGAFLDEKIKDILEEYVPENFIEQPVAILAIGYSADKTPSYTSRERLENRNFFVKNANQSKTI